MCGPQRTASGVVVLGCRGGVLWYPPTGRHATFRAELVDRFSGGKLIEHSGETDTEDLLQKPGLKDPEADR